MPDTVPVPAGASFDMASQSPQLQTPNAGPISGTVPVPAGASFDMASAPSQAPSQAPPQQEGTKAGFDLPTAGAAIKGAASGLAGVVTGTGHMLSQMVTGDGTTPAQREQLRDQGEAEKAKVYSKFKDDFKAGHYGEAFKGLTDLFTSDAGTDPNDPVHQMLEQQWQSSQQAKQLAMESAKKGDFAGVLQHSIGVVPIASQVDAAMTMFQKNPSRDNLKEVIAAAIPAFIPTLMKGAGKLGGAAVDATKGAIRDTVTPGVQTTPGGAEIPVRPTSTVGKAAFVAAPEEAAKLAQTRTSPAIEKALGKTIGEATGSGADTTLSPDDRMGLKGHADDLINNQAKPAYQYIDKMSNQKLSEAQEAMDNSSKDFSKEGREAYKKAAGEKKVLLDTFRDDLAKQGIDVDAADAAYRKGIAVRKMASKLDTATGASTVEGAPHNLDGTRLAKVVDDGIKNGSWNKMGLTDEHIAELQKLGDIAKEQTSIPKGKLMSGLGKAALIAGSLSHGGILTALEAVSGVSAADYIGGKLASHVVQDAIMNQDATKALAESMKTGNPQGVVNTLAKDPSWVSKIQDYVKTQAQNLKQMTGGEEGAAGAAISRRNVGEPGTSSLIGKRGIKATAEPVYDGSSNGALGNLDHRVTTMSRDGSTKVGELAAQNTKPDTITIRSNQIYDPSMRGQGLGRSQIEKLANEASKDGTKKFIESDISTTDDGKRPWQSLEKKYPDAVTRKDYANGSSKWKIDLKKWEQPSTVTPITPEAGHTEGAPILPTEKVGGTRISQRKPTAVNATENPLTSDLNIGMDAIKKANDTKPGYMAKLANTVSQYPGFPVSEEEALADPEGTLNKFINHTAGNLEWLHNQIPENTRGISKLWYDSAHELTKQWAQKYGVSHEQMAGAVAALSPQNEWNNNISTAGRVADILQHQQETKWTPEMQTKAATLAAKSSDLTKTMPDIMGKSLKDLDNAYDKAAWIRVYDETYGTRTMPNYAPDGSVRGVARNPVSQTPTQSHWNSTNGIAKAVSILEDGSKENIHNNLGDAHKIRNFYNNIIDPWSKSGDVTIDTHAVGAAHLRPMGGSTEEVLHNFGGAGAPSSRMHGVNGTYGLYAEAYRQAANKLGILPRELQSITGEGIRSLYESRAKTPELKAKIAQIWKDHKDGEVTIDKARKQIIKAAGGFKDPKWMTDMGSE